ncbi:MAG TPA: four helix bundle protein [Armatimonadota bacterium]|jgi:four helix bundle protein
MQNFRELKVWRKAHDLALDVYRFSSAFPADERYGLTSQVRRAAASVATNIAEGCGRQTRADFAHFLSVAMGSACETEYQLLLAHDLGYLGEEAYLDAEGRLGEVKRMLAALIQTLRAAGN